MASHQSQTGRTYRAGMAAYLAGRYDEAIALLEPVVNQPPPPDDTRGPGRTAVLTSLSRYYLAQAHYRLAVQFFDAGRHDQATPHFDAAARLNPSGGGVAEFLSQGRPLGETGGTDLEALLAARPDDVELRIRAALVRWRRGQRINAAVLLRDGLRRCPANAELHYQLGVMLAAQEDLSGAESSFKRALAMDDRHAHAHERLAQCHGVAGRTEQALEHLRRANDLAPGNARIALQLNVLSGMLTPAPRKLATDDAARLDPTALERLGEVIIREPDFVEAFLALPVSAVDREVFSVLAATLEHALARHPSYADLHYHCGAVYRRLGEHRLAIKHAEEAVALNPRYVSALILLGRLYGHTSRWSDGVARLEQAIAAGGNYPDVHYLLGRLFARGGQLQQARESFRRALSLNQNYAAAKEALASL